MSRKIWQMVWLVVPWISNPQSIIAQLSECKVIYFSRWHFKLLIASFWAHLVAVMVCFVTFRTPLHIEKAIFVITTVTQRWDDTMFYYFRILKLIAGMFRCTATPVNFVYISVAAAKSVTRFVSLFLIIFRDFVLLECHSQSIFVQFVVQTLSTRFSRFKKGAFVSKNSKFIISDSGWW